MNSRGMITIPADIRKEHNFKDGTRFFIVDVAGQISIIPIQSEEEFWADPIPHEVIEASMDEDRKIELELENREL